MTSALVLLAAVAGAALALISFVITQSILKFFIEPVQEQRKLIGEVADALEVYANVYEDVSPKEFLEKGSEAKREQIAETYKTLRGFSGKLRSTLWSIPLYGLFSRVGLVTKATDVMEASDEFIGWSNGLVGTEASDRVARRRANIAKKLGIEKKYRKLQAKSE